MNLRRLFAVLVFALPLVLAGAAPARAESNCNDGVDNDGDTFIDHVDTSCYESNCTDNLDNDGDGHFDELAAGTPVGNEGPDPDCQCLNDVVDFSGGCTANDVSFVLIGLGTQIDGCINSSDSVTIQLGAQLTTTANERYDIGMWVATDGNAAATARNGNACKREILTPVSETATTAQICDGDGPYLDLDDPTNNTADKCGEIQTANSCGSINGNPINAIYQFSTPVTVPCSRAGNGLVNLATCATWDNQSSNGAANKPHCTNVTQAFPGTSSKCRCEEATVSSIPSPNLAMTCGCTAVSNGVTNCTVSYTNAGQGTCNQAAATADTEFGCGVARYIEFRTSYPTATGGVTTGPASNRGTRSVNDPSGVITWRPGSNPADTTGWIGVNETDTLTFSFTNDGTQTSGNLDFVTTAYWSNSNTFTPAVSQASALTCSVQIAATPVTLAEFKAARREDDMVLRWTTATETGNAGFNVYAETPSGTRKLNDRVIKSRSVDSLSAQHYRLRVSAEGLEGAKFFLEDVSVNGWKRKQGPFVADGAPAGRAVEPELIDWAAVRAEHQAEERWRSRSALKSVTAAAAGGKPASLAVDLSVSQDGLVRVSYADLLAAGFDLGKTKGSDLALRSGGVAVPIRVVASSPGQHFGPGSYFEFYGQALDTLYTATNVYRLSVEKNGLRAGVDNALPNPAVPAANSYPATVRVEREQAYGFSAPNGDPWYDTLFQGFPGGASGNFALAADRVAAGAAELRVSLWGMTDWPAAPDHHVLVTWNGTQVASSTFDGSSAQSLVATLPAGAVLEGGNTLGISIPNDLGQEYDFVALDSYSVTYPRAFVAAADRLSFTAAGGRFQVSGLTSPNVVVYRSNGAGTLTHLAGVQVSAAPGGYVANFHGTGGTATYHVATLGSMQQPGMVATLSSPDMLTGQADYLIITHPDFQNGLGTLVAARAAAGLSVKVVDVREVYSAFSHGVVDAAAIQAYVKRAAQQLGTRYVLLVGGDSYDYRNFLGLGSISFVPSLYRETSPFVKFAPVDSAFADVNADGVQDVAIGRWPVRNGAELATIVAQTLAYQYKSYGGSAVFAADEVDTASGISFTVLSDKMRAALPEDWQSDQAYLDLSGVAGAKNILLGAINSGVALTSFVGHSGPTVWTFQGLFNNADVAGLTNAGAPTVVTQMGCWNTYYVSPTLDSLAQKLLLSGDRGAAAVLGATALTLVASDQAFGDQLAPRLTTPGMTLGQAVVDAKRALAAQQPLMTDVLLGFTILGDPALQVNP